MVLLGIQCVFSGLGGSAELDQSFRLAASQEKGGRIAIVIGNSNYPSGALTNPKNDATAMAAALKKLGFDVELKLDATKSDIDGMLRRFSTKAEKAGVAALFYAGHGIQVGGSNFIVPVDAMPRNEKDLKRDMVKMDDVIDDMGDAKIKLVFFDACRDNPLSRSFSRGGSRGMAAPAEATGTLISFATKHGNTAADGDTNHSPYTNALLAALETSSGVEIEQLLRKVQQGVKAETKGQQEPWRYGSLDGDFYFKAAEPAEGVKSSEEVLKRTNELAARQKLDLQQALLTQQAASDRAMAEALKKASEQSAKDRIEMLASMDKMLKEALAKQNAQLAAERLLRPVEIVSQTPPTQSSSAPVNTQVPRPVSEIPIQLAMNVPPKNTTKDSSYSAPAVASLHNVPGDEWKYLATDMYGKKQKLVMRVKAIAAEGVLEELIWDDKPAINWVFKDKANAILTPSDSGFMFASHWNGIDLADILVEGGGYQKDYRMSMRMKITGNERITVPAGTFDAIRLDGIIYIDSRGDASGTPPPGRVTIYYSKDHRRLLKQIAVLNNPVVGRSVRFNETLELTAIQSASK